MGGIGAGIQADDHVGSQGPAVPAGLEAAGRDQLPAMGVGDVQRQAAIGEGLGGRIHPGAGGRRGAQQGPPGRMQVTDQVHAGCSPLASPMSSGASSSRAEVTLTASSSTAGTSEPWPCLSLVGRPSGRETARARTVHPALLRPGQRLARRRGGRHLHVASAGRADRAQPPAARRTNPGAIAGASGRGSARPDRDRRPAE